ncbi:alpha/beta hydrolase family protein [Candidatus Filomicrobium marinum]|nr:alpha/beta family hydrolase [Candidatus Filomicrobium marinum]
MINLLTCAPEKSSKSRSALPHLLLAHGAGQGMASPFFETLTGLLVSRGIGVTRFEFAYMAARQQDGKRRPPPRMPVLLDEYRVAVATLREILGSKPHIVIGGKSMGGRAASMIADDLFTKGAIAGLVCLGYPFHPPKKPDTLRTAHLVHLQTPGLIVQGERDPFGTREDVSSYSLSPAIQIAWMGDGDHDLSPRVKSGFTRTGNLETAAEAIHSFLACLSK